MLMVKDDDGNNKSTDEQVEDDDRVVKTGTDKRCVDRGRLEAQKVEDGSAQKVRRAPKKGGDDKRVRRIYAEEEDKAASASLSGRAPPS